MNTLPTMTGKRVITCSSTLQALLVRCSTGTSIALQDNCSAHYEPNAMGNWTLKTTKGETVRAFTITDGTRDIIVLTMWVWRDLILVLMANDVVDEDRTLLILRDIRNTVGDEFYIDFLDIKQLPEPDEIHDDDIGLHRSVIGQLFRQQEAAVATIATACKHWTEMQAICFGRLRKLYLTRPIRNFLICPSTSLYKHVTRNSPSLKTLLLAHIDSLWDDKGKIAQLKDHQINVIVGYYLTEHMCDKIVEFQQQLMEHGLQFPFSAATSAADYLAQLPKHRPDAAEIIKQGLLSLRCDLAQEIELFTNESDAQIEEMTDILASATEHVHYRFPRVYFSTGLQDTFPGLITDFDDFANDFPYDDLIYKRLLTWLVILRHLEMSKDELELGELVPLSAADYVVQDFILETRRSGPLKWATKAGGYEMALGLVDIFMRRAETYETGRTMKDMIGVFTWYTKDENELKNGSYADELSAAVKLRCDIS